MKRSQIDAAIEHAITTAGQYRVRLPEWAGWSPERFIKLSRTEEAIRAGLGWKVVDFGLQNFHQSGLTALVTSAPTVDSDGDPITDSSVLGYPARAISRKLLFMQALQSAPGHYHVQKEEKELTLLAGGPVFFHLAYVNDRNSLSEADVLVRVDGIGKTLERLRKLRLEEGQTISLPERLCHSFRAGSRMAILQEVSTRNNDHMDNYFPVDAVKDTPIEEDLVPRYQLTDEHDARRGVHHIAAY